MSPEPTYEQDAQFRKLMARDSDADLTRAALELARDAYPELEMQPSLTWLDERAAELKPGLAARDERESLHELAACLADRHGLIGTEEAYQDPDSSYLQRVIETRRGIPISLSVIYVAVAERLGLPLMGVSAPMHFLARVETGEGPLFLDAFSGGRVLTLSECLQWLSGVTSFSEDKLLSALDPVGPRVVIVRMLNNLKVLYAKQENWAAAWRVQHRLRALHPTSYNERRDLGIISLHAHRPSLAIKLLRDCLRTCPIRERSVLEEHLKEARHQLSNWN